MKKYVILLLSILILILAGCKLEHNSRVKQTQLLGEITTIETIARVEVPSCTDYKDKTQASKDLIKTTNLMTQLFPDSEFEECKNENMKSLATYNVPMNIGTIPPDAGSDFALEGISLIRNKNGFIFFSLSKEVSKQIANGRKNAMTKDISLAVNIRLTNDSGADIKLYPNAVFIDGSPFAGMGVWEQYITVKAKSTVAITLSDVASESAIAYGNAPVYSEVNLASE